ncbi:MAG TPA: MmcQ/YjbR family DNA-binding protein [Candidatus Nanopelagicales bacterium]
MTAPGPPPAKGRPRRARPSDLDEIAGSLPGTELGVSWGDRPTWKVAGKGFILRREVRKDAIDPATDQPYDDLIVIMTADAADKAVLVDDPRLPFFTIEHFHGFNAVLVQESRLGELGRDELAEVITEAWAAKAPKRVVKEFFESQ